MRRKKLDAEKTGAAWKQIPTKELERSMARTKRGEKVGVGCCDLLRKDARREIRETKFCG